MGNTLQSSVANDDVLVKNIRACVFDIGGVVLSSPIKGLFDYEASLKLPKGTLWNFLCYDDNDGDCAKFERNEITFKEFCRITDARWLTHMNQEQLQPETPYNTENMVNCIDKGQAYIVPEFITAMEMLRKRGVITIALTNKWYNCPAEQALPSDQMFLLCTQDEQALVKKLKRSFDVFLESRVEHLRKRQIEFYDLTVKKIRDKIGVNVKTDEIVFIDDIADNLIPFKNMGVNVIHCVNTMETIRELERMVGYPLH